MTGKVKWMGHCIQSKDRREDLIPQDYGPVTFLVLDQISFGILYDVGTVIIDARQKNEFIDENELPSL